MAPVVSKPDRVPNPLCTMFAKAAELRKLVRFPHWMAADEVFDTHTGRINLLPSFVGVKRSHSLGEFGRARAKAALRSMTRILIAAAIVIAAMGLRPAQASEAPWCAIGSQSGTERCTTTRLRNA